MKIKMKVVWIVLNTTLVALLLGVLIWLAYSPRSSDTGEETGDGQSGPAKPALRIGLIPERDIFEQNTRYKALAEYVSGRLGRPVELVTLNTYEAALQDLAEGRIEGAFLGSFVAVLAMNRLGAQVTVKPESADGTSTYHGVMFVREDSPVTKLEDLAGKSVGTVPTTTAGHVFPGCVIMRLGLWNTPNEPRIVRVGTHDDVVEMVIEGRVDVGAVKNLRLEAVTAAHPEWRIRILAEGHSVPNNALLLRRDVPADLMEEISQILLTMDGDPDGRQTLTIMGIKRFLPCKAQDYAAVYDMIECIESAWQEIGLPGPVPQRPEGWPAPDPEDVWRCYDVNY